MKPEEFRPGNYLIDREGRLCDVVALDKKKDRDRQINALAIVGGITSLPVKPIKITEEWLLKLRFTNDNGDYKIESGRQGFIISLAQDTDWIIVYRDDIGCRYNPLMFLDYVHQLQNLYFALTGEELEIEE